MSAAAADGIDDRDLPKQELLEAAFQDDWEKISALVIKEKKVHIDAVDDDGVTALHIAAAMGQNNMVVKLLDNGARIDFPNYLGMTAYHYAAREGKLNVIDTLLQRGANTQLKTFLGVNALTLACAGGHNDVVRRLLSVRHDDARGEKKRSLAPTPLIVATCSKSPVICHDLVRQGAVVDETMDVLKGLSALSIAIMCTPGDYMVRALLDLGGSATKRTFHRISPEELAKEVKRKDLVDLFSDKRNYRSRLETHYDVRREIKRDMNIDRDLGPPPQNGCTLLMYAITVRSLNSAKYLINRSDVNMRDNMHITALHVASLLRVDDIIPALLQKGADTKVTNKLGSTAYDLFLMSCDVIEPGQIRGYLHCHRPDPRFNSSSSNFFKAIGETINKVSSQYLNNSKTGVIEPKHWLEARAKYQPAKHRNSCKFASVEDILRSVKMAKRPDTNEYDNETEAMREYVEDCQSFAVTCFTDFYGERDKPTNSEYYDIAQFHAKRSGYHQEEIRKLPIVRPRKDSIEREYRKPRNLSMMESPSQNQTRTTPRMLKKPKESPDFFSAQAGRPRTPSNQVPTVSVAPRQRFTSAQFSEEMIWAQFTRRQQIPLMEMLKKEEIDKHTFFKLKKQNLLEMGIYTPENLKVIEEIQLNFLS